MPFRVALFDTGDGGAISYDRPSSFLATLSQPELKQFGALLDQKIDGVIKALRSKLKSYRLSRH
ncbi:MAG TPA: hypothetical protein VFJ49_11330 [Methyloceanibacter sp.]|nr:hypothetical protein [Methyloceanibacter sp.]